MRGALTAFFYAAIVLACGPGQGSSAPSTTPAGPGAHPPAPTPSSAPAASSASSASGTPTPATAATTPVTTATAATASTARTPEPPPKMMATRMETDLREIGLDPAALPPLNKLSPEQLRSVMKTFTKALGVQCKACHDAADFRAPTTNKKTAAHMWNEYARGLVVGERGSVYCDSCHAGRLRFLDRNDLGTVSTWMRESYVEGVRRTDGREHGCPTCHGEQLEPKILTRLWH